MKQPFDLSKLRHAGFKSGFIDDDRRTATPHTVACIGLNDDQLGTRRFCQELYNRRSWIAVHCAGEHDIEPLRDAKMRDIGRLFRFADPDEAMWFKLIF